MKWNIDKSHSKVGFKVRNLMISSVSGSFKDYTAVLNADKEDFSDAKFEFVAKSKSIDTDNEDRDKHLVSEDFFNADKYPEIKFISKSFDGEKLVGDLTILETTKEVTLDADYNGTATDAQGSKRVGFEFNGEIKRSDFGLTWNELTEAGHIIISDKVKLMIDAQFVAE